MYNLFLQVTDNTVDKFEQLATIGKPVNVREVFAVHTFDTITRSMFGVDVNSHKGGNEKVIYNLEKFLDFSSWRWITVLFLPDFIQTWLGLQSAPDFILGYFEKTVKAVLEKRKQSGEKYNDILQVLLDAEAETEFAKGEEKDSFEGIEETLRRMNEENNIIKTTTVNVKKLSFN
ncbi:Cytochrome P450 3A11-like protein, partial [Leptotrombidium deliense]